jgi:hypothetical protein
MRAAGIKLLAEMPSQITQNCGIAGKLCKLTVSLTRDAAQNVSGTWKCRELGSL